MNFLRNFFVGKTHTQKQKKKKFGSHILNETSWC